MRRADVMIGALAMLLASPVAWSHHWVWAVPIALGLWERSRGAAAMWTAVFVARPILDVEPQVELALRLRMRKLHDRRINCPVCGETLSVEDAPEHEHLQVGAAT